MNRILITGVAGFIGRALAGHFARRGSIIYGVDRVHAENAPLADLAGYIQSDLPSSQFEEFLEQSQPDVILHCAGRASVACAMDDPRSDYTDGPALTFSLLDSVRRIQPRCTFVHLSSAAVYGNPRGLPISEQHEVHPISSYGFHKWQSEILCLEFASLWGMKTVSTRIFSAYGPGLRRQVLWDISSKVLTQPEVCLQGTGQESRDFIHSQDIACGIECILQNGSLCGEPYNLASGEETTISDIANMILSNLHSSASIAFSGQIPAGVPSNWRADISAISQLGFRPQTKLQDGIAAYVSWASYEIRGRF